MHSCLVPESKFDPVTHTNPVVDSLQVVLDDVYANPDFLCDFTVFQALRDQHDDSLLAPAQSLDSMPVR